MLEKIRKNKNSLVVSIMKCSFVLVLVFSFFVSSFGNESMAETDSKITIATKIDNPIGEKINDIPALIKVALEFVVKIGGPVIVFFIVYSGFLFISAQGNKDKMKKAKDTLLYVIIGAVIVLGAFVISKIITGTVEQLREGI